MVLQKLVVITSLILAVHSTWYSSEHMICDSSGTSWIPFTGFKIHRHYVVKDLKPPMLHFISLSHCNHGELSYERLARTGRETDVEWDKPFCMLSTETLAKKFQGSKNLAIPVEKNDVNAHMLNIDEVSKKPHSIALEHMKPSEIHNTIKSSSTNIKRTFNDFLRKISSKLKFIEYTDDSLVTELESLNFISYQNVTLKDLDDLKCYKLARRKKYAQREMMIYAPYTWVGGLFECKVSQNDKEKYLNSLKDLKDFSKPFEFKCTSENSTPLLPLIADDVTTQWIEKEKGWTISQRIPYLYTPGLLDLRYGKPAEALGLKSKDFSFDDRFIHEHEKVSKDSLPYDKWKLELEVNEDYNYTIDDISLLTKAITYSSNTLNHFLKEDYKKFLPWEWDKIELMGPDQTSMTYLEGKFLGILSKMKDRSLGKIAVDTIQVHWDNLTLSTEHFKYKDK